MSDVFLKEFYQDVRGPDWPNISSFKDFCQLPSEIQQECYTWHNFQTRRNELENEEYWRGQLVEAYQFENLVYFPVTKCAHTYYKHIFKDTLGWKLIQFKDVDFDSSIAFGMIIDPFDRYIKGLAEWVHSSYWEAGAIAQLENELQSVGFNKMLDNALIGDIHTLPYSMTYGSSMTKINWIPLDLFKDDQVTVLLNNFFKKHNHNINLPLNQPRINQATNGDLKVRNLIKQRYLSADTRRRLYYLYFFYAQDLKFYHNLVEKFIHPQATI